MAELPYGSVNPVANCSRHYDIPVEIGMSYVDYLIHGIRPVSRVAHPQTGIRPTLSELDERQSRFITNHIRPKAAWDDLLEIAQRMPAYWDRRPGAKRPDGV